MLERQRDTFYYGQLRNKYRHRHRHRHRQHRVLISTMPASTLHWQNRCDTSKHEWTFAAAPGNLVKREVNFQGNHHKLLHDSPPLSLAQNNDFACGLLVEVVTVWDLKVNLDALLYGVGGNGVGVVELRASKCHHCSILIMEDHNCCRVGSCYLRSSLGQLLTGLRSSLLLF